jgi:chemotaxis protein histidine kinase CheA
VGTPLEVFSKRGVVAVLASGVVISLTALTGGIAPAFAQPGDDSVTTTVVVPEPEVTAPEPEVVAPQAPAEVPTAVAPQIPQAPATQQAPQTQAPETQAPAESPSTAVAPPVTSVEPAEPSEAEATAPVTTTAPNTAPSTPETTSTSESASESATSTAPSGALVPGSETASTETSSSGTETATNGSDESDTPTVSISEAAQEIKTVEPQTLVAPAEDVELASKATPVDEPLPAPAAEQDVAAFSNSIENSLKIPGLEIGETAQTNFDVDPPVELVSPVKQWSPDWVQYDEYYRPIILNPYRDPVRIVYMYEMTPRIMVIPPLGRMVFEAAQYAAYNFTAALLAPVAAAVGTVQALHDIAVGSFFGGGYYPGVGMAAPPPPPPVMRYDNVPVYVNYSNARYEPFRVNRIVDVGDDAQFGERKVLLDGVTPAWGVWSEAGGERIFEVHRTQQFPGLEAPQEGPLPGDYRLKLASDSAPADGGMSGRDIFLMVSAGVIGTLGVGAIGLAWFLGRRRTQVH